MIYVVSDLHGCLDEWKNLLKQFHFNDDRDTMFVLGDSVDFGAQPIALLHDLMERPNVFSLLGNHELMFARFVRRLPPEATMENLLDCIDDEGKSELTEWMQNGGQTTLRQYLDLEEEDRAAILDYIEEMTLFEETEADGVQFVLTHAGLDEFRPERPLDDYTPSDFLLANPTPGTEYFEDRTVIVGHTPTFRLAGGKAGKILDDGAVIYIDCGAAHKEEDGMVGCLRLDDFSEFYA